MTKKKPISTSFSPFEFFFFLSLFLPCFHLSTCFTPQRGKPENKPETHGIFVFGASLVDNGNNNFLANTSARADYLPYGIDFPLGASGRFSNGKNVIDALGNLLKLPHLIPPFSHPLTKGRKIVHGVNYASGGSGILDETGSVSGRVISLNEQIRNFEEVTMPELNAQPSLSTSCSGRKSISDELSNYMFVVASGGNDYLLNYFLPSNINKVSLQDFTSNLTVTLSRQIKRLHSLGARKFMLMSVYPIGCIPVVKASFNVTQGCLDPLNQAVLLFNSHMQSLVDALKPQMPGSNLVYVNSYEIIMDIIKDPSSQGFNNTSNACCEVSTLKEGGNGILCKRNGFACKDRKGYVFFDGLHTTESANVLIANKAYSSNLSTEVYPFNVQQLADI